MKAKLPLRLAMFQMGIMILRGPDDQPAGELGPVAANFASHLKEFNATYNWVQDKTLFGIKENGSYTGVLRLFASNQSDALLLTLPISPEADVAELGPVCSSAPSVLVSVLLVSEFPDTILKQLFRFSIEVVILLAITMLCFAITFEKSESKTRHGKTSLMTSAWCMIALMLLKGQLFPKTQAGKILVLLTSIAIFFWYQIWQNQMKSDMFAFDTRLTAKTLAEVLQLNLTPVMLQSDPSERQLEHIARIDPGSEIGILFRKAVILTSKNRNEELTRIYAPKTAEKHVTILNQHVFNLVEGIACVWVPGNSLLVLQEKIGDSLRGPWFSRFLSREYKQILHKRFLIITETGLHQKMDLDVVKGTRELARRSLPEMKRCIYRSMKAYLDEKSDEKELVTSLTVSNMNDVFRLFCFCLTAACAWLSIERQTSWRFLVTVFSVRIKKHGQRKPVRPRIRVAQQRKRAQGMKY